jgi:hypothetical protein
VGFLHDDPYDAESFRSLPKLLQHLTKDILTTQATKVSDIFDYKLRAHRTTMVESFRSLRKFCADSK